MALIIHIDLAESSGGTTSVQKTIVSDIYFKSENQKLITSDIYFDATKKTINSDIHFKGTEQKIILSDIFFVEEELFNINNKVNFAKRDLFDIDNKVGFVKRVLYNILNFISFVKSQFYDIKNDFRCQKRKLYDIRNDVRFIASWQKVGEFGFQSLGKEYIRVYIKSGESWIDQTDVDLNSIKITKDPGAPHIVSFILGRKFDDLKPEIESEVQIKYKDTILYTGYITEITPVDDPEKIQISCQDEYWKQNRTKKYFFVGHEPKDNKEKYYETIKNAIENEFSWNLNIGNFVPETISCFTEGQSDVLKNLIEQSGNFSFFYDVNKNKRLWSAGEGNIIDLNVQKLGKNLKLYDVISHKFSESIEDLVNKYRVQMGDKVIKKFSNTGGTREYSGYINSYWDGWAIPNWNRNYEVLAKNAITRYGWDYHHPEDNDKYKDIFKKYSLPYLPTNASLNDAFEPYIEVYSTSSFYGFPITRITEGFTIDFENRLLLFNEPKYFYRLNKYGELEAIKTPLLKVIMSIKKYYTFTSNPEENPEEETTSPLIFFTEKMGEYPTTIIDDLQLSTLNIQEGGTFINSEGETEVIPSWDDTDFAMDFANWQLSKICDKKITGEIEITLDTLCFYGIDLDKRIRLKNLSSQIYNIISISIDINSFTARLSLENSRYYKRNVSLQTRGE